MLVFAMLSLLFWSRLAWDAWTAGRYPLVALGWEQGLFDRLGPPLAAVFAMAGTLWAYSLPNFTWRPFTVLGVVDVAIVLFASCRLIAPFLPFAHENLEAWEATGAWSPVQTLIEAPFVPHAATGDVVLIVLVFARWTLQSSLTALVGTRT